MVYDLTNTLVEARKLRGPVVLGSNVLRDIQASMEDMYGAKYGERVNSLATEGHGLATLLQALKIYQTVPDFQTM